MAFEKKTPVPVETPVLEELDDGVAYFSDKSTLKFPEGTKFTPENWGGKLGLRIFPPNQETTQVASFCVIKGATKATIEAAIAKCEQGV